MDLFHHHLKHIYKDINLIVIAVKSIGSWLYLGHEAQSKHVYSEINPLSSLLSLSNMCLIMQQSAAVLTIQVWDQLIEVQDNYPEASLPLKLVLFPHLLGIPLDKIGLTLSNHE